MTRADWIKIHGITNEQALDAIMELEEDVKSAGVALGLLRDHAHQLHEKVKALTATTDQLQRSNARLQELYDDAEIMLAQARRR